MGISQLFGASALDAATLETIRGVAAGAVINPARGAGVVTAELYGLFTLGQSTAHGTGGKPALSRTTAHGALMFNAGVRPSVPELDIPAERASLIDHVESDDGASQRGETHMFATQEAFCGLYKAENGMVEADRPFQCLSAVAGAGGQSLYNLRPGTGYFEALLANLTYGKTRADEMGLRYAVPALTLISSEQDQSGTVTEPATYAQQAEDIRLAFQDAVRTTLGDPTLVVPIIAPQNGSWASANKEVPGIALTQLDMALTNPNYILAGPTYQFPYFDDLHFNNQGYYDLGGLFGLVLKRIALDGVDHKPIVIESVERQDKEILLTFANVDRLALDTVNVSAAQDFGFSVWTHPASSPTINPGHRMTLTTVKRYGAPNQVLLKADTAIPASFDVRYAWYGDAAGKSGPVLGPRGNLRRLDSHAVATKQGRRVIREWAPVQRFTVS